MLTFDNCLDAASAVCVCASCDHRLIKVVETDGAKFLAFDMELQHVLESLDVLGCEWHHLVLVQQAHQLINTILAKCPVVADLTKAKDDFQQMRELGRAVLFLEVQKSTLCLLSVNMVSEFSVPFSLILILTGMRCISPARGH